ncbi:glycosyltransferase [Bifidobacterium jacchi]|uniref:Glycosyltransferase n=1 Tax=Bifidobacterium jacchi TaxID=2490545 RepID=A0A5N5RKE6_9BIFI|nr:glycosyltransferase [Bifidobacterium jacchi]
MNRNETSAGIIQSAQREGIRGEDSLETGSQGEGSPLVSVIIPVYGVERFLDACVQGVVAQTYRNLEILLVDDGSPDRCPAMCDAWAAKDGRIRVIHKTNGGLSDARNAGLAASHGDWIYFVDSDDMVAPSLIERTLDAAHHYDADLVMFQFDTISETGRTLKSSYRHNDFDEVTILSPVEAIKAQVKAEIDSYFWSFIAAAPIYREHGFSFPVGRKIEDMARICNVIGESHRVVRIPEVLYHYRMRQGSIMSSWNMRTLHDWMASADDREAYILARYPELRQFMKVQQLNFLANLDYETIRQSIVAKFKVDPRQEDALRDRIAVLSRDLDDEKADVPESTRSLIELLKRSVNGALEDFDQMREDWARMGRGWLQSMRESGDAELESADAAERGRDRRSQDRRSRDRRA